MRWKSMLKDMFGVDYPIIQAPMLGVSTPAMAAAVSNAGGLGSLAVGGLSPEVTRQLIRETKALTSKPFAVNLFAHDMPAYTEDELEPMRALLIKLAEQKGYKLEATDLTGFRFYNHLDQIDILCEEDLRLINFTFGCLDVRSIQALKGKGAVLMGTATCLEEALHLKQQGIDMIVAQGLEAGGHRGTFLESIPLPQIGLFSLLPQIVEKAGLPCIAAGGINSARTIQAAFELGAEAVQIGTAFIPTTESVAIPAYKASLAQAAGSSTQLTRAFSGRWARGIRNEMMEAIENAGIAIPLYPLQNSLTTRLRKLAQQADDDQYTNLWAGQSAGGLSATDTRQVFLDLVRAYEAL